MHEPVTSPATDHVNHNVLRTPRQKFPAQQWLFSGECLVQSLGEENQVYIY